MSVVDAPGGIGSSLQRAAAVAERCNEAPKVDRPL
jgi:hypothetical protein